MRRDLWPSQKIARLTAAIATPFPAAASIGDADPQVMAVLRLAKWVGLTHTADAVMNVRLALLALLPNIAGLVLAFGVALRRR